MTRLGGIVLGVAIAPLLASCGDPVVTPPPAPTTVTMDFSGAGDFYAIPFPNDARIAADGTIDLSKFYHPNPTNLISGVLALVDHVARGFGTTSPLYFELSGPIDDTSLPTYADTVKEGAAVTVIDADPASPRFGERAPVALKFYADGGPYGAPNLLAILPLQGRPLAPGTRYAAFVTSALHDAHGSPIAASTAFETLTKDRTAPSGMSDAVLKEHLDALDALTAKGLTPKDAVAMTVFTTENPTAEFDAFVGAALSDPLPTPKAAFAPDEVFDTFCVYHSTIDMPVYQDGEPPYDVDGGEWTYDKEGKPLRDHFETANFVVTVPRTAMPTAGYPIVVLSRTGAGGDRPLVDRGVQAMTGGAAITPGTGPALYFANAGFAGSEIDGPHGGLRNITQRDEQFLMFNVANPGALRDNVRQSALELVLQAHILENVTLDVSNCPGAVAPQNTAKFDSKTMVIMGHSMGATISPLALSSEPRFRAALLSGAGGSWIENVMYKLHPLAVKGPAELLIGYAGTPYSLTEWDPALGLYQWALEGADPPVFGDRVVRHPVDGAPAKHVLMMQGIVDHYILPPIANGTSLSFGLDLAGPSLDSVAPETSVMPSLASVIGLGPGGQIALPASLNITSANGDKVTAVVTQHAEDGIEDGHEVVFQTEAPKHEYVCFLKSLLTGAPRVPSDGKAFDPCD